MSNRNGGHVDPFRHTEITLQNLLRMQGYMKGPTITHYPVKMPTRSWLDIVEAENDSLAHMSHMASVIVSHLLDFQPSSMIPNPAAAFLPGIDVLVYKISIGEELSRTLLHHQFLKERAQLTGSPHAIHCTSHFLSLQQLLRDASESRWSEFVTHVAKQH